MDMVGFTAAVRDKNNEEARRLITGHPVTTEIMSLVAWHGNTPFLRYLLHNRNALFDSMALDAAVFAGHTEALRCLLMYDGSTMALMGQPAKYGRSLLHRAALTGNADMVSMLLRRGAMIHVNTPDTEGSWPLHLAVLGTESYITSDTVRCLVEEGGALVNAPDKDGDTPLHCAVYVGNAAVAAILMHSFSALPDLRNNNGHTPADLLDDENPCASLFQPMIASLHPPKIV